MRIRRWRRCNWIESARRIRSPGIEDKFDCDGSIRYCVPKTQWAKFLGPQLLVKATRAFLRLPNEDAKDYDTAKREILNYFQLDSKSYLHAFRSTRREGRETYRMLLSFDNDIETTALRDTGHNGVLIVDPDLVRSDQYVNGKSVHMMGVFDTQFIELPVAQILFRSPKRRCYLNLLIEVAVARMPQSLGCNIGNQLFHMFPQLNDIISQTRPRTVDADTLTETLMEHNTSAAQTRTRRRHLTTIDHLSRRTDA